MGNVHTYQVGNVHISHNVGVAHGLDHLAVMATASRRHTSRSLLSHAIGALALGLARPLPAHYRICFQPTVSQIDVY